jgi:hypothetical protein
MGRGMMIGNTNGRGGNRIWEERRKEIRVQKYREMEEQV